MNSCYSVDMISWTLLNNRSWSHWHTKYNTPIHWQLVDPTHPLTSHWLAWGRGEELRMPWSSTTLDLRTIWYAVHWFALKRSQTSTVPFSQLARTAQPHYEYFDPKSLVYLTPYSTKGNCCYGDPYLLTVEGLHVMSHNLTNSTRKGYLIVMAITL